jgi:predicted AAA+ superfamily ATPase
MELINRAKYVNRIVNYLGKGLIIVLTGQRRVGKSCIMQCVVNEIKQREKDANVIYINKEYTDFNNIKNDIDLNEYIEMQLQADVHNYLFIDEVQDIDCFENTLRSLQAQDKCEIVITGSNAKMLSGELSTYLSGRYIELHIQSLNYTEFLQFHKMPDGEDAVYKYLTYGGLPQLAQIGLSNIEMVNTYLNDVYNTVIMKDVISRENIRNVRFLTDLVKFVADNAGKNISANSISKFMKGQGMAISPTLVNNYMGYLCNAYIINKTSRFDIRGRRLFETNEKYYFEDLGLRNSLIGLNMRRDIEKLLENAVYLHLCACGYTVTVGILQNAEIDFVAERHDERRYIQVSYTLASEETVQREFGNLQRINDNYSKMVVCMDKIAAQSNYSGIECCYISDFLKKEL